MLDEMRTMREIFGGGQQQQANPMDMLVKGIELANSMAPKVGGETSGMDVLLESIKSFAPAIGMVVAQAQGAPRQPRPAGNVAQTGKPAQIAAPGVDNTERPIINPTEDEDAMMFKYYINMLVGFAKEGRDPVLYADLIADNLPDDKLTQLANDPDIISTLSAHNMEVRQYSTWFESVQLELKIIMGLTEPVISNTVDAPKITLPNDVNGNNESITGNIQR
jgi:hypothetical protein